MLLVNFDLSIKQFSNIEKNLISLNQEINFIRKKYR